VKYCELYKIEATRLKNWDYSTPGWYFITIVCHNFTFYFDNPQVKEIVNGYWSKIPEHFAGVRLGEYIVMPNHMHGVIEVLDSRDVPVETRHGASPTTGVDIPTFETRTSASLQYNDLTKRTLDPAKINDFYVALSEKSNQIIPNIIRSFKSAVTKNCHENHLELVWQPRFYDHIVRSEASLTLIENYIRDNPENWSTDRNNISRDGAG